MAVFCIFMGISARAATFQTIQSASKFGEQVFSVEMATTENCGIEFKDSIK